MRENASLCRPLTTHPVKCIFINRLRIEQRGHFQMYTWSVERANVVNIKGGRVWEVKVGQARAWESSGKDAEGSAGSMDGKSVGERLVPGCEELRCELWGGTFCSWLRGPTADSKGAQTDTSPSCLAQIHPGGSRRVPSPFIMTSPHAIKGTNYTWASLKCELLLEKLQGKCFYYTDSSFVMLYILNQSNSLPCIFFGWSTVVLVQSEAVPHFFENGWNFWA